MMYCPNCKQMVATERGYSGVVLILLLCIAILPGIIYWLVKRGRRCPMCKTPQRKMLKAAPVQLPGN